MARKRHRDDLHLSKREQQIMELIYQRGSLTASELTELLPGEATNSTVRTLLKILEIKGRIRHVVEEGRFVYLPAATAKESARSVLLGVAETFFRGSIAEVVVTLLSEDADRLSDEEWARLKEAIDNARSV